MLTYEYIIYIVITILLHIGVLYFLKRGKNKYPLHLRHVVVTGGSRLFVFILMLNNAFSRKTIGSSGIGLWAAIYAARLGAHVTIIARNVEALSIQGNERAVWRY